MVCRHKLESTYSNQNAAAEANAMKRLGKRARAELLTLGPVPDAATLGLKSRWMTSTACSLMVKVADAICSMHQT